MKLELNENTLNAYLNEAMKQELGELDEVSLAGLVSKIAKKSTKGAGKLLKGSKKMPLKTPLIKQYAGFVTPQKATSVNWNKVRSMERYTDRICAKGDDLLAKNPKLGQLISDIKKGNKSFGKLSSEEQKLYMQYIKIEDEAKKSFRALNKLKYGEGMLEESSVLSEEELDEIWGLSRREMNDRAGYEWDPNKTWRQNRAARRANLNKIKSLGFDSNEELIAATGYDVNGNLVHDNEESDFNFGNDYEDEAQVAQNNYDPNQPGPFANDKYRTMQFQTWFNDNMRGNLVVDGIWGPKTQAAWSQWVASQR